jgi:formamidase
MITPDFRGGHEVTRPVAVEGDKVGDALAIIIESMRVLSLATSSGMMVTNKAAFGDDPFVDRKCPGCGTPWPSTRVVGTGEDSIHCTKCGTVVKPFGFEEGYTIVFDHDSMVGAHHPYGMSLETLNRAKTDAHLDTYEVRAGAVLVDSSLIQLFIWLFF